MTLSYDTLPSGFRMVSEHLPHVHSVAFAIAVNVGARYEMPDQGGISHLLEHMAFKGTSRMNAKDIAEAFDRMGGNVNAYTSHEHTVYYAKVLKEYAEPALRLLCEIVRDSQFDEGELAKEREVILQEIAMHQDSPDDVVFDLFQEVAFANQPLGRSILGAPERVASFTRDDLMAYTAAHYQPHRMVLAGAGAVDHRMLHAVATEFFASPAATHAPVIPQPGIFQHGRLLQEKDLEQVQLVLGVAGCSVTHEDYYALQIFSMILGGGMSSRLFQEVRESRGLAYSVSSYIVGYQDCGVLGIYAGTTPEHMAEMLAAIQQVSRSMQQGVTDDELLRARNQMKASIVMTRENVGNIAEWMARHMHVYGRVKSAEEILAAMDAVTGDDLVRVANQYLLAAPMTLTALGQVAGSGVDMGALPEVA